ncbi:MAG: thioesterase family protein [Desulfobacula sp.]|uniref:acyl-CoA thioesterase n=1 Tax=Desulfobacula sp. TaxID=2593537 RepID=UPI0025C70601|nr:thioesterase family protein [Desulfobacula sp.]MCD4720949.1 thioesterase family protein [Desulfobacula sp.]
MIENLVFATELAIRISDLNYADHVGNDAFVSLIHEARVRFLKNFGFSEPDVDGKGLIVADLAVSYKSLSFYGDKLKFEIGAGDFNKYGCDIFYRVTNIKTGNLVLLAKTGIVFFDYAENKIAITPEAFSSHFL